MFEVPLRGISFPRTVAVPKTLTFTARDLAHAIFVTGRAPGDEWKHGGVSLHEWQHRSAIVPAYIRRRYGGWLVRSWLADELDRTEKMGVSYVLGQAMTGIFGEKVLGISRMLHIDRYGAHHRVRFGASKRRADLIGQYREGWAVLEAKGRSSGKDSAVVETMREQVEAVRTVEGKPPTLRVGCVAYTDKFRNLRVDAHDPDGPTLEPVDFAITTPRFLLAYYAPFVSALRPAVDQSSAGIIESRISEGVRLALPQEVVQLVLRTSQQEPTASWADDLLGAVDRWRAQVGDQVHPDGSRFTTEWEEVLQLRDWLPNEG